MDGSIPRSNVILDGTRIARLRAGLEGVFEVEEIKVPQAGAVALLASPARGWTAKGLLEAVVTFFTGGKEQGPFSVPGEEGVIYFYGRLLEPDADRAYSLVAERWQKQDYTPMLARYGEREVFTARPGVVRPKPSNPRVNLVLFVVTLVSVLLINFLNEIGTVFGEEVSTLGDGEVFVFAFRKLAEDPSLLLIGLPFTVAFLAILGTHEFGHYFAAKYHKSAVTLPYFIPFPTLWGTLGAVIQLRSPTRSRRELLDVGAAGPLAGLVVAVPLLVYGLMHSELRPLPTEGSYILEGGSLLYVGLKYLVFGRMLPGGGEDVFLHPVAWAGWSGLFVTAINLFPVGQLDGGHVLYALFGEKTRYIGRVIIAVMVVLGFFWSGWFFWALVTTILIGTGHPPPLNDITPLGKKRRLVGWLIIVAFVLVFIPIPLRVIS